MEPSAAEWNNPSQGSHREGEEGEGDEGLREKGGRENEMKRKDKWNFPSSLYLDGVSYSVTQKKMWFIQSHHFNNAHHTQPLSLSILIMLSQKEIYDNPIQYLHHSYGLSPGQVKVGCCYLLTWTKVTVLSDSPVCFSRLMQVIPESTAVHLTFSSLLTYSRWIINVILICKERVLCCAFVFMFVCMFFLLFIAALCSLSLWSSLVYVFKFLRQFFLVFFEVFLLWCLCLCLLCLWSMH